MQAVAKCATQAVCANGAGARGGLQTRLSFRFLRAVAAAVMAAATTIGVLSPPATAQDYGLEGEAKVCAEQADGNSAAASMLEQRATPRSSFRISPRPGFLVGGDMVTAFCSGVGASPGMTTRPGCLTDFQAGAQTFS